MVNKELLDYIRSVVDQGYTRAQIKEHLLNYNYPEDVIDAAFLELDSSSKKQELEKPQPVIKQEEKKLKVEERRTAKKTRKPNIMVVVAIVFILILAAVLGYYFFFGGLFSKCSYVEIEIFSNEGVPWMCVYPDQSKLHFLVKNTGNTTLNHFKFELKGSEGGYSRTLEEKEVDPGEIFTRSVDIPSEERDYGEIKKIIITPGFYEGERVKMCRSSKIVYEEKVNTCIS